MHWSESLYSPCHLFLVIYLEWSVLLVGTRPPLGPPWRMLPCMLMFLAALFIGVHADGAPPKKPHIVMIVADDLVSLSEVSLWERWDPLSEEGRLAEQFQKYSKLLKAPNSPHLTSPHLTSPHLTSPHPNSPHPTSPHLTSPHLTSPHLTPTHLTSPHPTSPHLTSPHLTSPHLTPPHLTSPHLTSPHLTSPHPNSPHLTSPHLTSPHLTSPHLTPTPNPFLFQTLSSPPHFPCLTFSHAKPVLHH